MVLYRQVLRCFSKPVKVFGHNLDGESLGRGVNHKMIGGIVRIRQNCIIDREFCVNLTLRYRQTSERSSCCQWLQFKESGTQRMM